MFVNIARIVKALLTRKVSQCDNLLAIIAIVAIAGCQMTSEKLSALAPKSTVIAQAAGTSATKEAWQSVAISYARHVTSSKPEENVALTTFRTDSSTSDMLQVLVIRYPHPDGQKDRARVELVIADPRNLQSKIPWYRRLGKTLNDTLPGMEWGEGISHAMALDLPIGELRLLLTEFQSSVVPATTAGSTITQVQLVSEINGQHNEIKSAPIPALERLASRVAKQGKLVAYSGTASELHRRFGDSTKMQLADDSRLFNTTELNPRLALIPLPPIDVR